MPPKKSESATEKTSPHIAKSSGHYDTEIKSLIDSEWRDFSEVVNSKVSHLKKDYTRLRNLNGFAIAGFTIGLLLLSGGDGGTMVGFLTSIFNLPAVLSIVLYLCGPILVFLSIVVMLRWNKVNKAFNLIFNPLVFNKAFEVLSFEGQHMTEVQLSEKSVIDLLDHSELITEYRNLYQIDDMVSGESQGRPIFVAELDVKSVTGSGKHKSTKNIFHGVLIAHELPKTLTGKTFITTEGDTRGFGNMSLWRRMFKTAETPKETVLEWNDFENKLHVATTNEIEARYILTPDFMQALFDWWSIRKGKIRVSFIDNRLYVLYSDRHIKIGSSVPSLKEKDLKKYVLEVARPLWHTKKLMECTEVRFRQ